MSFPIASTPWCDWYHVMGNTYGTWLPGDPKGFRTRHHREHVDGDYKNPPPKGTYDKRWKRFKELMKRDPVYLTRAQRNRAVQEFVRAFKKWKIELRVLSIDRIHVHGLIPVPDHNPRHFVGLAKKESSAYMKRDGLAPDGGLWAVRCKCLPITDRAHFDHVVDYIRDHEAKGAAIWEWERAATTLNHFDPSDLLVK
jgi:REP element-mobilizing transposase RayT